MKWNVVHNEDEMAKAAAQRIADVIRRETLRKGKVVLGLATGSTPIKVYEELVRMHKEKKVSFENVVTFNLDEYVVDKDQHPGFYNKDISYHGFMDKHLFNHVNIKPENIHVLHGMAEDKDAECRRFEQLIKQEGGIDLQLVGIGENGHLGFCEPNSPLNGRTSEVKLTQQTIDVNRQKFDFAAETALSMGLGTINEAKEILLIANGAKKAPIIGDLASGIAVANSANHAELTLDDPETARTLAQHRKNNPAMLLKYHSNATAIVDEAAAGQMLDRYKQPQPVAR